ncbi:hypothetical protein F5H01DRAFT_326199 [Linnemannia elongata]|nr:hypothetical protein F5H01DRAFT_326199 [Linnemannia elongata]
MVFNFARLFRPLGPADPEIDPAYLPDNITSYTEGPITEPATNQSPDIQGDPPIDFQALSIDAAAAQSEFDQDLTFVGGDPVAAFTGVVHFNHHHRLRVPPQMHVTFQFYPTRPCFILIAAPAD